MGAFHEPLSVV